MPTDVTAELIDLEILTEEEMRQHNYGSDAPGSGRKADEYLSRTLRATFTVVESNSIAAEVGDEAQKIVGTGGRTHEQVRQGFSDCKSPTQPSRLAKAFGKTATCNGLPPTF